MITQAHTLQTNSTRFMIGLDFITLYMTAWNSHEPRELAALHHPRFEGTDIATDGRLLGPADVRHMAERFLRALPDLRFIVDNAVIEGQMISISWKMQGTHDGFFMGIPPSGREVEVSGMTMLTMEDEQIRYARQVWDLAGFLRDIGLLPRL